VAMEIVRLPVLRAGPNPFRGGLRVEFTIPVGEEEVDLRVFDVTGRLVRTLASGRLAPGVHRYEWDGRNGRGGSIPAGVYFVRLEGRGTMKNIKVLRLP